MIIRLAGKDNEYCTEITNWLNSHEIQSVILERVRHRESTIIVATNGDTMKIYPTWDGDKVFIECW